jgi:septum formation protein
MESARVVKVRPRYPQRGGRVTRAVDGGGGQGRAKRDEPPVFFRPRCWATEHHEFIHKRVPDSGPMTVLASGSAIRRALLQGVGLEFTIEQPEVDENALKQDFAGTTEALATMLAAAKAVEVGERFPGEWVIGSDSIAECRRFDKPRDRAEAAEHLRFFSGKALCLISAVALARAGVAEWEHVERARLWVRRLSEAFIEEYLAAEWPGVAGCVGVFRMEGRGATLFEAVEGSHFTVLGLPLLPLLGALRERGEMTS